MTPPKVKLGQYYQAPGERSKIWCRGYTAPPGKDGYRNWWIEPGEIFGPVEHIILTEEWVTVLAQGSWINIWKVGRDQYGWPTPGDGIRFATAIPNRVVREWKAQGWVDDWD